MKNFFFTSFFLLTSFFTNAQTETDSLFKYEENIMTLSDSDMSFVKQLVNLGDSLFFNLDQPDEAFKYYLGAYDYMMEDPEINMKIGQCFLASITEEKYLAIPYLKKAIQLGYANEEPILYYYLGQAYHFNEDWDNALLYYEKASSILKTKDKVYKRIAEVKYGKLAYSKLQKNTIIRNLGPEVNSKYSDFCPLVDAVENDLFFTSRRHEFRSDNPDIRTHLSENIYFSHRQDFKNWSTPTPLSYPLNNQDHTATVSISMDGSEMILYRSGDLYISYHNDSLWSKPKKLPNTINTVYIETSACLNYTMDTLYFVSNREDLSIGGLDIFMSVKDKNGKWSKAKSLGPTINSVYDEEGVALSRDGNTLFFSSRGHDSIGGYDVFKSTKNFQGNWGEPENLGVPINSPADDVYYMIRANGRHAYYSSSRKGGYGEKDIYRVSVIDHSKQLSLAKKEVSFLLLDKDSLNSAPEIDHIDHLKEVRKTTLNATADLLKTIFEVSVNQVE